LRPARSTAGRNSHSVEQPASYWRDTIRGEFFAGRVDDVRIDNRVLLAVEIQADVNSPVQ